jgi:hypothetical protein
MHLHDPILFKFYQKLYVVKDIKKILLLYTTFVSENGDCGTWANLLIFIVWK